MPDLDHERKCDPEQKQSKVEVAEQREEAEGEIREEKGMSGDINQ